MKCVKCCGETMVVKTELLEKSDNVRDQIRERRRVCRECRSVFYTYEVSRSKFRAMSHLAESSDGLVRNKLKNKRVTG